MWIILFSDFTHLILEEYDFSTAKLLMESRTFNSIRIDSNTIEKLKDIHINSKEIVFNAVPFTEVMKLESVNTTSLDVYQSGETFKETIFGVNIKFVFLF